MNIGLIAHDNKKKLMQNFCIAYYRILKQHELFATGATGRMIEEATNLTVHKFHAGNLGGGEQMAMNIENNLIDMVFFLQDPYFNSKNEPDRHEPGLIRAPGTGAGTRRRGVEK